MTSARDGAREAATAALLDAVLASGLSGWLDGTRPCSDPDWDGGLEVLALVLGLRWQEGSRRAAALSEVPVEDADAWRLRRAATLWAASGDPGPTSPLDGGVDAGPSPDTALGRFGAYLLVEAVLAHARLDLASSLVDELGPLLTEPLVLAGTRHPFGTMAVVCRARVLAFRGDIAEADRELRSLDDVRSGVLGAVVSGTIALVGGNDADAMQVRRAVAEVDLEVPRPEDHLGAGAHLLAAFGEIALGETARAARRVLLAGGDPDLARLNVADRALGLEILATLAVGEGDLDAASAWADRVVPLLASPIADATAGRVMSRVALLDGRADEAVGWAERAVARARDAHRLIEYAEGEIVLSRARLEHPGSSGGDAARALAAMVAEAERRGHRSARRSAARELKVAGRRLPPVAGSGWAGLTPREAEVARLVAAGTGNADVAARMHVSEHTVRAHVSRVLTAFAVPTRSALPAAMFAESGHGAAPGARPSLTSRQEEVAALVSRGLANELIADQLGVSRRTVERHVSDALVRWSLPNRTALARAWHHRGH